MQKRERERERESVCVFRADVLCISVHIAQKKQLNNKKLTTKMTMLFASTKKKILCFCQLVSSF
jgi:hypothetical protein